MLGRAARAGGAGEGLQGAAAEVLARLDEVVLGKHEVNELALCAVLAGGHLLLEDVPGVGKTTLAVALARLLGLDCARVQFTPDVTPSDVVGFSALSRETGAFEYRPGAVFCNLLLADEINRASPKTQSALLEVMEEGGVTVDGVTRPVPDPFAVIATENPLGSAGTQPLPPSQLDRFMACASLGYPGFEAEVEMAAGAGPGRRTDGLAPVPGADVLEMRRQAAAVHASPEVCAYAVRLVAATRADARLESGASPRASMALVRLARAAAWLKGADYVAPADVEALFLPVARHRVSLSAAERAAGARVDEVLGSIRRGVARPRLVAPGRRAPSRARHAGADEPPGPSGPDV